MKEDGHLYIHKIEDLEKYTKYRRVIYAYITSHCIDKNLLEYLHQNEIYHTLIDSSVIQEFREMIADDTMRSMPAMLSGCVIL